MKKLLFVFMLILMLAPTVNADYMAEELFLESPDTLYSPPSVSLFSTLSADEILYRRFEAAILDAAENGALQKNILIPVGGVGINFDVNDEIYNTRYLLNIYVNVVYNHPEIGNLITAISSYVSSKDSTDIVSIKPYYREIYNEQTYQALETAEEKASYLERTHNVDAFNDAVKYAYSKALAPDMTEDWQKLLSIHDYLADTITYSPVIASGTSDEKEAHDKANNYLVYTTYSALVGDRISVCQGYSLAFKLLCDMAGIECGYATTSKHIWNIAECDGTFYHIDVTWDDPVALALKDQDGNTYHCTSEHVMHTFFLRSDADSTALHSKEGEWTSNMPACDDSDYYCNFLFGESESIRSRILWEDGFFWFEAYSYSLDNDSGTATFDPTGRYYMISDTGITGTTYENYPPNKRLEAKMYSQLPFSSETDVIAIDGVEDTTADLFMAIYEDDTLVNAYKTDITFNAYGEAVAEIPNTCNCLFLFKDGQMLPLAYSK